MSGWPYNPATAGRGESKVRRLIGAWAAASLLLTACASGPSASAIALDQQPATTTTTEPTDAGIFVVRITNGSFSPSNVTLDLNESWIVEWHHEDAPREYTLIASTRGEDGKPIFESPLLKEGDTFRFDFSELEPKLYRYFSLIGKQRIPGFIDTRPER